MSKFKAKKKKKCPWILFYFVLSAFGGVRMLFGSSFEKLHLASVEGKVTVVVFTFITLWLAGRHLMLS